VCDQQQVRRIPVDGFKGRLVRGQVFCCLHPVSGGADLVSGNQVDDRRKVDGLGPAKDDRGRGQFKCFQNLHIPSLPGLFCSACGLHGGEVLADDPDERVEGIGARATGAALVAAGA
jgi:hypothetical protein